MSLSTTALERIVTAFVRFEKNTFYKALQIRAEKLDLDVLKELGDGINMSESDMRFRQGIREGLRRAKTLPSKFINEIEIQMNKGK